MPIIVGLNVLPITPGTVQTLVSRILEHGRALLSQPRELFGTPFLLILRLGTVQLGLRRIP